MPILRVALDVPLPRLFDYRADDAVAGDIGCRVVVPFGRGRKVGLVVGVLASSEQPDDRLKPVEAVLRDMPPLPADWAALCEFCSRYYQYPLGQVMAFALPPMLRRGKLPRPVKPRPPDVPRPPEPPCLLPGQQAAVAAICAAAGFEAFLLHGITGSGKTEVYLHTIADVLARGRQALMLVPEIALTPQLEQRVRTRFPGASVVAAHSGIADAARARGFLEALTGRADIVLGTRLSVFMPLPRLGLIVVDEEHDGSFKQQEGLRYSARDVAVFRAKQANVPIVLGSATPSLESFHHALSARYRLLELTSRAVAESLPTVRIVDTRREKLQDGLGADLLAALGRRLELGEQSLIFLNRRGYAPVLACPACGWISRCRRCAANLVVHLADRRLRCHHCGLEAGIPRACPDCGNQDIHPFGRGTQRLESAISERFPGDARLRSLRPGAAGGAPPGRISALRLSGPAAGRVPGHGAVPGLPGRGPDRRPAPGGPGGQSLRPGTHASCPAHEPGTGAAIGRISPAAGPAGLPGRVDGTPAEPAGTWQPALAPGRGSAGILMGVTLPGKTSSGSSHALCCA